jgi:nicotinamidase-related amidase
MPISLRPTTALILIDIQVGFDDPKWGPRNNPDAERNAGQLLLAWRAAGRPIFHVQHASRNPSSPLHPSQPGFRLKSLVTPENGEPLITKNVNSAFIGTNLAELLQTKGIRELVIAGLTTPHCVSTTTRMAGNLGYNVYLVSDATAAFQLTSPDGTLCDAETVHRVSLTTLHGEFAEVVDTASILRAEERPSSTNAKTLL